MEEKEGRYEEEYNKDLTKVNIEWKGPLPIPLDDP